ncbi:hypothetical protein ANANG_G00034490 [Anguilla anguilla]|uniref:Uncharacterized protein n=1 Tax=Anguilla anguilla TaxID=7936 RepID=A0A9D3MS25_ANGAN|nr:hypothetical protein ANANG_G00034490 [Anguilla anguilla]
MARGRTNIRCTGAASGLFYLCGSPALWSRHVRQDRARRVFPRSGRVETTRDSSTGDARGIARDRCHRVPPAAKESNFATPQVWVMGFPL